MGRAIARRALRAGRRGVVFPEGTGGGALDYALSARGVTFGNQAKLLLGGNEAFPAMLAAIEAAEREVLLESYIFAADETGSAFLTALSAAARRGVLVRLMVDGVGSFGRLPHALLAELERSGAQALIYRPVKPWRRHWGFWRRDHRKLLMVDGQIGFLGGLNIANEYDDRRGHLRKWRDLHLELRGPSVVELVRLFVGTWNRECDAPRHLRPPSLHREHAHAPPVGEPVGVTPVQVVWNRFWLRGGTIRRSFLHAVKRSQRSIRIANPYFVPDRPVSRALIAAAKRGVDVRVVIPERSDVLAVDLAARAMLPAMLKGGVRVAEWRQGMMHAKAASVDDAWATVGSYNLDRRSLRYNLEVTANLFDPVIAGEVAARIGDDFSASPEIDLASLRRRPLWWRLIGLLAYLFRAWL